MSSKAKGGITKGKSHAEGGMPMVVKSTGQKVELEGGEGVINKKNMADTQKHEFEGKMLTKCEIASEINSDGGNGVEIDCDGIVGKKYKHEEGGRINDYSMEYLWNNIDDKKVGNLKYNLIENNFPTKMSKDKKWEYSSLNWKDLPNRVQKSLTENKTILFEEGNFEEGGDVKINEVTRFVSNQMMKLRPTESQLTETMKWLSNNNYSNTGKMNERDGSFYIGVYVDKSEDKFVKLVEYLNSKSIKYGWLDDVEFKVGEEVGFDVPYFESFLEYRGKIIGDKGSYLQIEYYEPLYDKMNITDVEYDRVYRLSKFAKGGEIIFTDVFDTKPRSYKSWETRKSKNTNENSFGAFAHRYNDRYKGDYYLYRLSQYDEDFYSHIPLKEGEILARVETDNMIGGEMPLVKININNGRVYFMSDENKPNSDEDDKNPKFNRASADVIYLSLDESTKDYEKFGYDKHSRYKNIRYETDLSSYDIDSLVRRMDNYYDINYEELFGLNKQSVIDFITSYNMGRGMASFELQEFFQIESALNEEFFQSLLKEYKRKQFGDDFAKGGKVSKEYKVFNYTDNIYASNQTFYSVAEANKFIKDFRKRFEVQGYYRDNRRNKISPEHIDLEVIEETFSPYGFAKGGSIIGIQDPYELENQGNKYLESQGIDAKKFGVVHYDGFGKNSKLLKDVKGKDDEGNLNPLWMYERTPETKSMTKGFQRGKKIYAEGGEIMITDHYQLFNITIPKNSKLPKFKGSLGEEGVGVESKKGLRDIAEIEGLVTDEWEVKSNIEYLESKGYKFSNSIDYDEIGNVSKKYAKGGNLDGFDETYNRFADNIREAFGQPRNNNIVRLESDFGFKKSELPQLRTKDKGLFVKMLVSKYGANVVTQDINVKAKLLKPIQSEINLKQVEVIARVSKGKMNPNKPITISKDGYIIDGHHRWYYAKQNDLDISVLQINLDANKVIDEIWQSGLAEKEDIDSVRKQNGGKI